jgi:hypothetical protein
MTARRVTLGLLAGVLTCGLALAGCSRNGQSQSSEPGSGGVPPAAAPPGADADTQKEAGGAVADAAPPQSRGDNAPTKVQVPARSLIYTGTVTVRVDDVVKAADRAVGIATVAGGVVGGDRRTLDDGRSEAQLVLRVPADKFASTLDELAKQLGHEESRAIQTQDVTEEVVDLDARLATQRASVARVRQLLARARTIGEVVAVESELTRREAELASLEQRMQRLSDLVALSTITLNLRGPDAPTEQPTKPETGFLAGLKSGWHGFVTSVGVVLTVAGWLLPWLIAIGVPLGFALWLTRRRRLTRLPVAAPVAASSTEPPAA